MQSEFLQSENEIYFRINTKNNNIDEIFNEISRDPLTQSYNVDKAIVKFLYSEINKDINQEKEEERLRFRFKWDYAENLKFDSVLKWREDEFQNKDKLLEIYDLVSNQT